MGRVNEATGYVQEAFENKGLALVGEGEARRNKPYFRNQNQPLNSMSLGGRPLTKSSPLAGAFDSMWDA